MPRFARHVASRGRIERSCLFPLLGIVPNQCRPVLLKCRSGAAHFHAAVLSVLDPIWASSAEFATGLANLVRARPLLGRVWPGLARIRPFWTGSDQCERWLPSFGRLFETLFKLRRMWQTIGRIRPASVTFGPKLVTFAPDFTASTDVGRLQPHAVRIGRRRVDRSDGRRTRRRVGPRASSWAQKPTSVFTGGTLAVSVVPLGGCGKWLIPTCSPWSHVCCAVRGGRPGVRGVSG